MKLYRRGQGRTASDKEQTMERIYEYIPGKTTIVAMAAVLWIAMTLGTAFAG